MVCPFDEKRNGQRDGMDGWMDGVHGHDKGHR